MQAEVKLHEPSLALDGGSEEGLDCLVEVCDGAVSMLRPGGFMAVETAGALLAADRCKRGSLTNLIRALLSTGA